MLGKIIESVPELVKKAGCKCIQQFQDPMVQYVPAVGLFKKRKNMSKAVIKEDPELYKRLCEPFPSLNSANNNLNEFFEEFRALREKYGIPDVVIIARAIFKDQDEIHDQLVKMSCGDRKLVLPMLVDSYKREHDSFVAALGLVAIPAEIYDKPNFFANFLVYVKGIETLEEAEKIIKRGEIKVNGKPLLSDCPAPDQNFTLTYKDQSVKIPGKNSKDINSIPK